MTAELIAPRTIGVCGSSRGLPPEAIPFCGALGRRLARDSRARIVSGGTKQRSGAREGDLAADWLIVSAACDALSPDVVSERIVTVIRDESGSSGTTSFRIGAERRARGKTGEARRISFVRGLDALIAVCGSRGTSQELALAIEHDIRVLPVPSFPGAASEFWQAYRPDLIEELRIDEDRARRWEAPPSLDHHGIQRLADDMIDALFRSLPRRCFVIMPFDQEFDGLFDFVIAAALRGAGDEPIRVDRVGAPGDVRRQIEDGLKHCEYALAVLDDMRPNVVYEVGIAHGYGKTTILMNREGALGPEGLVPFDFVTQQRLQYTRVDAQLTRRLQELIQSLSKSRR